MGLQLTINGVDFTTKWRLYESRWTSRAYIGESFQGEFWIDDDGTIDHANLASRKIVEVWEDASGLARCLYRGRVANKQLGRHKAQTGERMRWLVTTEDYNIDLRGIRIPYWARDSENDYARVNALRIAYLSGAGSTAPQARTTTDLASAIVSANAVTLPDANGGNGYRDVFPFDLLQDLVSTSGKTFFVYVDDAGDGFLYYADHTDTSYASDISISDDGDADGEDIYAPELSDSAGEHDGQDVVTGGQVRYGEAEFFEDSDLASGESFHDKWEEFLTDEFVHNDTEAEALLIKYVGSKVNEQFNYVARFLMSAANVHRIKAGMQVPTLINAANKHTSTDQRAVQVTVEPRYPDANGDAVYHVTVELGRPRGTPLRRHFKRAAPWPPNPGTPSEGGETTLIDWDWQTGPDHEHALAAIGSLSQPAQDVVGVDTNTPGEYYYNLNSASTRVIPDADSIFFVTTPGDQFRIEWRARYSGIGANRTIRTVWVDGTYGAYTEEATEDYTWFQPGGLTAFTTHSWNVTAPAGTVGFWLYAVTPSYEIHDLTITELDTGTPAVPGDGHPDAFPDGPDTGTYAPWPHAHTYYRERAPTEADDETEGYHLGDVWVNSVTLERWQLDDVTEDAAVWTQTSPVDEGEEAAVATVLDATMARLLSNGGYLYAVHQDDAGDNQIFMLAGYDGTTFELPIGAEPLFTPITTGAEARDPSIMFWDGAWWLVHTGGTAGSGNVRFTIYTSTTLEGEWTLVTSHDLSGGIGGLQRTWAPEFFRDPEDPDGYPYVFFAAEISNTFRLWQVRASNRGLTTFGSPAAVGGTGFPTECIDPYVAYVPGDASPYKLFWADDTIKDLGYHESTSPITGYTLVDADLNFNGADEAEAPCLIHMHDGRWRLYYNKHDGLDSEGAFYRDSTDGLATWGSEVAVVTPWLEAHGTVVKLPYELAEVPPDAPASALDDLTDVTITAAEEDQQLQYIGGEWVNNHRRWEPVVTDPGTGPELVFDGSGDIVMTWVDYA